jgi:hypothetical protein
MDPSAAVRKLQFEVTIPSGTYPCIRLFMVPSIRVTSSVFKHR